MAAGAIYCGRPGRWRNHWRVGLVACGCRSAGECNHNSFRCETAADAVAAFRDWRLQIAELFPARHEDYIAPLRGHDLVCWCRLDMPCHVDVLLELANT